MSAGSIVIDLLMKTGSFETDSKRAEKRLKELKKEAQQMGVAVGAAFAAVGTAAAWMVKSSIDAMDEMSKLAQKVGTSVESLSALTYAADLSGVSQEALGSAMVKLSKNMSDAAMGTGEAAKGFAALGISVKNADGSLKSSDQILGEVADKFAGFKDGAEKTALAVNLFGKSGADLIPLLNGGASGLAEMRDEATRLGVVLDTETSKAAEAFNDNLTRVGAAVRGVANLAATELLPALNDVSQMLVDVAKNQIAVDAASSVVKAAMGGLINVFQTVAVVGSDVGFVFLSVGREIGAWAAQLAALARGDLKGFSAISDAVKEDGARARAELDKFQARVMALGKGSPMGLEDLRRSELGPSGSVKLPAPRMAKDGEKGKDHDADFKAYLKNLEQQVQKTQDLTVAEKLLDDIRRGSLTVTDKQKDQLLVLANTIDKEKEHTELMKVKREAAIASGDAVQRANEIYQDTLKKLLDSGPAAQLEKQRKDMLLLADAFEKGAISAAQFNDAATGYLSLTADKVKETKSLTEELGLTFASAFEDAMVGGGNLSDIFKGLLQDVVRLILRIQVIEPMMKQLKEGMNGLGGGGGGDWFGSLLGSIGSLFGGKFADGGNPPLGKVSLVGERGPELFVPRTAGTIVPNHALGGGNARPIQIVQNMTVGDVASMSAVDARLKQAQREMLAGMDRANRYGRG